MTIYHPSIPPYSEQLRLLKLCDFNINMFEQLSVSCAESHRASCKEKAEHERSLKAELTAYFAGDKQYSELTWPAKERMMRMPEWATKGT